MIDETGEAFGTGAQIIIAVSEIRFLADQADQQIALEPAFADAGIELQRLQAWIGADDHDRIGLFDSCNAGVDDIAYATARLAEHLDVLAPD